MNSSKTRNGLALFLALIISSFATASERYLLNAGDILSISVWNEEALQREIAILPDGMISFPLAGELKVEGSTVTEVQSVLTQKLADYIADPVVTVSVSNVSGNAIHIMGKVGNPGVFTMTKNLDVMQALSLAGGLSPFAEENNIIIIRRTGEEQNVIPVHYAKIKDGKDLSTNVMLKSGDIIVIP